MTRQDAFTLTELLVLVAVGALAGTVILPSLGDAKERVRAAACASNLREISLAIRLYTDDHNGFMPTASDDLITWPKRLAKYLPLKGPNPTSPANRVFVCPSANYTGYDNQDLSSTYSGTGGLLGFSLASTNSLTGRQPRKITTVDTAPAETPLVIEGKKDFSGSTPNARSTYPWNPYAQSDLSQTTSSACLYLDFRHNDAMNIAYVDGSVRLVTFTQAKQFTKSLWEGR